MSELLTATAAPCPGATLSATAGAHACCPYCLQVVQHNFVCNLSVVPASLPAAGSNAAGCSAVLLVAVETENQQGIDWEALSSGLSLSLEVPDASEAAAAVAGVTGSSKGKAGRAGKGSKRPEALVLSPECLLPPDDQKQVEGLAPAAAEAAAAAAAAGCVVCFRTPQLTVAGGYTVAAEYRETREQLLAGLTKEVSWQGPPTCA